MSAVALLERQVDYWWRRYVRTWKGSVVSSFLEPLLYLLAMGVLLGGYVDEADPRGIDSSYLVFVAPGLLAAAAMQLATQESMWPVMSAIKWDRHYYAMLATPLRVVDIVRGNLAFIAFRLSLALAAFTVVVSFFGVYVSALAALGAYLAGVLVGLAFACPVYAWSAGSETEASFALIYRIGVVPMFLFSGAFFPVSNLPAGMEVVARVLPLYHGVELCRSVAQGTAEALPTLVHLTYLLLCVALGSWWAVRRLTRRLVV